MRGKGREQGIRDEVIGRSRINMSTRSDRRSRIEGGGGGGWGEDNNKGATINQRQRQQ